MSERYELGLSRNRLFEFDSTVVFKGKFCDVPEKAMVQKALKMLSFKLPVLTSHIELSDDAKAFIVTGTVEPEVCFSDLTANEIITAYERNPLRFYHRLFELTVSKDGYLIIAGHTAFCDSKSLLRIAAYFAGFYNKSELSVESEDIYTFSQPKSLPVDVISPFVNKLSSELDDDWQKLKRTYNVNDYDNARNKYLAEASTIGRASLSVSAKDVEQIRGACLENGVDFSSAVCFAFYKAMRNNVKTTKKSSKMRISADRRFFHGGGKKYTVGAYNGTVCVHLTSKELRKNTQEQLKLFHTDIYKALTSPFRVFSDEVLLNNVQADFCDSSYIFLAGGNRFKASKNLAQTYGCMNEELSEFLYCNLTQSIWNKLDFFDGVYVSEPFQAHRSRFSVTVIETNEKCDCELRFDSARVSKEQAENIIGDAKRYLLSLKN